MCDSECPEVEIMTVMRLHHEVLMTRMKVRGVDLR